MTTRFAVVRHPDVEVAGILPESAYEQQRATGWYRVSEWSERNDAFVLADYTADSPDLDAVDDQTEAEELPSTDESTKEQA
jgi:hypothetical protein